LIIVIIVVVIVDWSCSGPWSPARSGTFSHLLGSLRPLRSERTSGPAEAGLEQRLALSIQDSAHLQEFDELCEVTARHVRTKVGGDLFLFFFFLLPQCGIVIIFTSFHVGRDIALLGHGVEHFAGDAAGF